jgi:UDP-N-acetylglucosamine 4,6-dehydratase/5-epimerase
VRVLVTGGSGFLGRRLGPALAAGAEVEVVLAARNQKLNMLAAAQTGCRVLGLDVTSIESVRDALRTVRPDVVIHGAATKFVDLAERQPLECVDVNVLGSENVARACMDMGVRTVIGISTDKAAPPVRNTYGLSKAIMERTFCSLDGTTDTRFLCVRYGNVAWSTGSVLPVWKRMHTETGVIGTTGPQMRRFFFTVDEAVALVQVGLAHADELGGKVLSRHMKAALIRDLLDLWIETRGGRWEQIEGRPGEREDEFLVGEIELPYARRAEYSGIEHYVITFNERSPEPLDVGLSSANTTRLSRDEMLQLLEMEEE